MNFLFSHMKNFSFLTVWEGHFSTHYSSYLKHFTHSPDLRLSLYPDLHSHWFVKEFNSLLLPYTQEKQSSKLVL